MDETLLLPTARKRRRSSFWPFERDDSGRLEDSKGWIDLDLLSPQRLNIPTVSCIKFPCPID